MAGQARSAHATTRSSASIGIAVTAPRHHRGPLHRRRAAAAPRPGRHRRARRRPGAPPPDVPDDQRHRPQAHRRPPSRRPAWTGSTSRWTPCAPTSSRPSPAATATRTSSTACEAARDAGLTPVKVNTVLMPGLNDDEAPDLLAWAVEHDYELRFIEQMPLDAQHGWKRDGMITAGDILDLPAHPLRRSPPRAPTSAAPPPPSAGSWTAARTASASSPPSPARSARPATAPASPPTARSAPACSPARRRTCAPRCAPDAPDEEIARIWQLAMWGKKAGAGLDDPSFLQPDRPMSAIGG